MNVININGKKFTYEGVLAIKLGKFYVNGEEVTDWNEFVVDQKEINVSIEGHVQQLSVDCCNKVSVKGNCGWVKTVDGDIEISGGVFGHVQTVSGNVNCSSINGEVITSSVEL